jgi:hypothetical protein
VVANAFHSARQGVREFFLLEKAEQTLASLDAPQRTLVRNYYEAGNRRLHVAQDLRGRVQTPAALTLYREGSHFLAIAYLASRGRANLDPDSVSADETFQEFESTFEAEGLELPPAYRWSRSMLVSSDPLALDRLSAEEASRHVQDLETTSRWLAHLIDARSASDLTRTRILRIAGAGATTVLLLVMLVLRLITPRNLALDKPATASSYMGGTVAAAAVDGFKNGTFGYHSQLEDSPWLSIDLGRAVAITKIKVFGRGDGHYEQSIPLALEVSDDGVTYQQIAQRDEPFSEYDPWIVPQTALVTRYLRLKTLRRSYLVIGEVEVTGTRK